MASTKVFQPSLVQSRGPLSWASSAKIPELTTRWFSISLTVWTNALVDHGGFLFWAAINWSNSSHHTPAEYFSVSRQLSTSIWIYSHPIACCFLLMLILVSHIICKCASWAIVKLVAFAASQETDWSLRCSCVSPCGIFNDAPINLLISGLLAPSWGVWAAMICWCGNDEEDDEEDDNKKKWDVLRNI